MTHTERQDKIRIFSCRKATARERKFYEEGVSKTISGKDDMRPEYDFSSMKGAVRRKYYKAYRAGHQVLIHKEDGTTSVQYFKLEDGAVMLEPDVRKYFSDSESVNKALRSLIAIIPSKRRTSAHTK